MWYKDLLQLPLRPSSATLRAQETPTPVSRRPNPLSSLFLLDGEALRLWEEHGGERDLLTGEGFLRYAVRKVSLFHSHTLARFCLRLFPGSSSVVFTDATDCATLMTVGYVRILVESHGSCGELIAGFYLIVPSPITAVILPSTLVRICATLQVHVRRSNLAPQQ